jgi:hypothetical protein
MFGFLFLKVPKYLHSFFSVGIIYYNKLK